MSTVTAPPREYSLDQLAAMANGKHYELVDGHLEGRTVSGLSSYIGGILVELLNSYCRPTRLAYVFPSDYGYACFADKKRLRRPDVSCVLTERLTFEQLEAGYATIPPDLAVEVLSPNDLAYKVAEKVDEYLKAGVRLIWVVDPIRQTVLLYRLDGSIGFLRAGDDLSGEDVLPGFHCLVADLFGVGAPPSVPATSS